MDMVPFTGDCFRDEEFPIDKPAGEFRVLALGDSITYGMGVPARDTWPKVVQRGLAEDGAAVRVINCGFAAGSYDPAGYETWMETDGLLLDPDLVLMQAICLLVGAPSSEFIYFQF